MKYLITGGAGFIGSALIRHLMATSDHIILNLDSLSYAGNLESLESVSESPRYSFERVNICNFSELSKAINAFKPDVIMHLAAESHVDRSIDSPSAFMQTNIMGTYNLLESIRGYLAKADDDKKLNFRFHHISTDEVYGDLDGSDDLFREDTPYAPSSPYSASKASSDHLVRAWGRTYNIPYIITNCSNNYGPFHFPEKLIPHTILNAIHGKEIPIYGKGTQIRDWLFVDDHAEALSIAISEGILGETYNIGGYNEKQNIEVVESICNILDKLVLQKPKGINSFKDLITFVPDRPGHDARYAIDSTKITRDLGWMPKENFESGLLKTIHWYLENTDWWERVLSGEYKLDRIGKLK